MQGSFPLLLDSRSVSAVLVMAGVGEMLGGGVAWLSDRWRRPPCMLLAGVLFAVGLGVSAHIRVCESCFVAVI